MRIKYIALFHEGTQETIKVSLSETRKIEEDQVFFDVSISRVNSYGKTQELGGFREYDLGDTTAWLANKEAGIATSPTHILRRRYLDLLQVLASQGV